MLESRVCRSQGEHCVLHGFFDEPWCNPVASRFFRDCDLIELNDWVFSGKPAKHFPANVADHFFLSERDVVAVVWATQVAPDLHLRKSCVVVARVIPGKRKHVDGGNLLQRLGVIKHRAGRACDVRWNAHSTSPVGFGGCVFNNHFSYYIALLSTFCNDSVRLYG